MATWQPFLSSRGFKWKGSVLALAALCDGVYEQPLWPYRFCYGLLGAPKQKGKHSNSNRTNICSEFVVNEMIYIYI